MKNESMMVVIFIFLAFISNISFSSECFPDCDTCSEESEDSDNMKCLSCIDEDYSILYNTKIVFTSTYIKLIITMKQIM